MEKITTKKAFAKNIFKNKNEITFLTNILKNKQIDFFIENNIKIFKLKNGKKCFYYKNDILKKVNIFIKNYLENLIKKESAEYLSSDLKGSSIFKAVKMHKYVTKKLYFI